MKIVVIGFTFLNKEFLLSKRVSHISLILLSKTVQPNHFPNNCHRNFKYTIYLMYVCPCIIYEIDERYPLDATIYLLL